MFMLIKINFVSNIAHLCLDVELINLVNFCLIKASSYKKIPLRGNKPLMHYSTDIRTLNLLIRILENKVTQEKINISACVNGIPYINGAREMGVHERIASVT